MNPPTIDVIIAVYNGEDYIKEAIESVQAQSWKNLNIIIADDGSTDQTNAIISALRKADKRIHILTRPHFGVSATLNAAIGYSTAPYIAFLDADDLWNKYKLKKQMEALSKSNARICFCFMQEFESFEEGVQRTHSARVEPIKGYSKIAFLGKRTVFDTYGLFDEKIAIGDFVDWYSRVVRAEEPVIMLEEVLAFRRIHDSNTTRFVTKNNFLNVLKEHLDKKRRNAGE